MTTLRLLVLVGTLAVMAVAVGLLFVWRLKTDPALGATTDTAASGARLHRALYWLASVCLCIGVATCGYLVYRFHWEAV